MLAAVIAAGSPMPVRAADFEIEEEVILGGTGGESTALYEKESEETLFQGTVEVSENEIADQDMQASLDKAANYLKTHVTNPVVNFGRRMVWACNGKVWESAGGDKKELSGKFVSDIGGKPRCSGQTKIYRIFESSAGAYGNRGGSFGCQRI